MSDDAYKHIDQAYCGLTLPAAGCVIRKTNRGGTITFKAGAAAKLATQEYRQTQGGSGRFVKMGFAYTVSEKNMLNAAKHMANDMKLDLERYFAITSTLETDDENVRLRMLMAKDEETRLVGDIEKKIGDATKFKYWFEGRKRLVGAFDGGFVAHLGIAAPRETYKALAFAYKENWGPYVFNPFTWRTPSGARTLETDVCSIGSNDPYNGKGAAAASAVSILLHEIDHKKGCMILESGKCIGNSDAGEFVGTMVESKTIRDTRTPFEKATGEDMSKVLSAHPDMSYRDARGKTNCKTYVGKDPATGNGPITVTKDANLFPGRPYFILPNENVLRSTDYIMDRIYKITFARVAVDKEEKSYTNMAWMIQEFSKIRGSKVEGYNELKRMRDWYASKGNPLQNGFTLRPRIAMDAILHRHEGIKAGFSIDEHWLLRWDCTTAKLPQEEYDLVKRTIEKP